MISLACESEPDTADLVQDMVVQTNYDRTVDFQSYGSYTLSLDTIGYVTNRADESALSNGFAKSITSAVKRNLDAAGLAYVSLNDNPDLGINVFVVDDVNILRSVYYPDYFWGYPGYPGSFYGGYFGYQGFFGYPFTTTTYFRQALLVIEMVDLQDIQNDNARVVWTANIGDLINTVNQDVKTIEAIDQAFRQSTYLQTQP